MERILIIEDEEKIARFVELELQYEGYEVEKAFNGRDGLELASTRPFDLVCLISCCLN
jgi:DNA-binding response OmpR family regulator